ncbi:MAG: hypothetical protein M1814_002864 [Vezdaea aestivalis]|nr:MAG: hypothetical protein M1814_002864 [Vezdaea aestivalis]
MRSSALLTTALCLMVPTLSVAQSAQTAQTTLTSTVTRTLERVVATTTITSTSSSSTPPPVTTPLYIIPQNVTVAPNTTASYGYTIPVSNATSYTLPTVSISSPPAATATGGAAGLKAAGWGAIGGLVVAIGAGLL